MAEAISNTGRAVRRRAALFCFEVKLPISMPMKAWKLVDLEHAGRVSWGQLRLGTLASFAELENGRADAADGRAEILTGHVNSEMPEAHALFQWCGGPPADGPGYLYDCVVAKGVPPMWAFCMAAPGWCCPSLAGSVLSLADGCPSLRLGG